jgi:hypothetical protein
MSTTDAGRSTDVATSSHPVGHPAQRPGGDDTSVQDDAGGEGTPSPRTPRPVALAREGPTRNADLLRPTTPATTLVKDGRRCATTRTSTSRVRRPITSDRRRLSAGMIATLSAELEGRVARDLVADIVRAVLDETRQAPEVRSVESTMLEARQRLGRFIRARSSR